MTERQHIELQGVTQGVGFRPAVYNLAVSLGLCGWVVNDSQGVMIEIQGEPDALELFQQRLLDKLPPLARIDCWRAWPVPIEAAHSFEISFSRRAAPGRPPIPPDVAICSACRRELFDVGDRRYLYPFITCTHCGPRFTLVRDVPFDRERTAMDQFPMCSTCDREYRDPANRRFHAQTTACWDCGPLPSVIDAQGRTMAMGAEALPLAIELLLAGRILAIKGIGGFHLAVNARDHQAVALLRQRKQRERKPFALMASDVSTVRKLVDCGPEAADLLSSPTAPIVLLEKLPAVDVLSPEIAPANPSLGIMLPYSPLHELLFRHPASAGRLDLLVMTSGNISDEPIQYENQSAVATLQSLADAFLLHNRDIVVRSDDSIFQVSRGCPVPIRIARGVIPSPLPIKSAERVVVGVGAELKNAVFFLSPAGGYLTSHIGDLKTLAAYEGFRTAIAQYETFFNLSPDAAGYDLHPDFLSTRWVRDESGLPAVAVQHHHAHIAALMAEHGLAGPLLGIALDGTGLGSDGQIWGGEFLVCTRSAYERVGHLRPFPLPGGEAAIRSPARIAWACWQTMCSEHWPNIAGPALGLDGTMQRLLDRMLDSGTNCPQTTSAGRLFDAVSAYLGLCHRVTYEGEAAIALEAAAAMVWRKPNGRYTFAIHTDKMPFVLDPEPMWRAIAADRRRGVPVEIMAQRFISGLANGCAELAARLCRRFHLTAVAISGGVCQNRLLMDELHRLDWSDLTLYVHRLLPPNDACIAVGQAVVAEEVLRNVSSRSNAFAGDQTGQSGNS